MTAFQLLIKATQPRSLFLGFCTAVAGWGAAALHGNFELLPAILCLLFALFAQAGANIFHRYRDCLNDSAENVDAGLYEYDSRESSMRVLKEGWDASIMIVAILGLAIMNMAGWWPIVVGAILVLFLVISNYGMRPFSRAPLYPLMTFLAFGPVGVIGTSLVQSQHSAIGFSFLNWFDIRPAVIMGIIFGCMSVNVHILYLFRALPNDLRHKRESFVIHYGRRASRIVFFLLGVCFLAVALRASVTDPSPYNWVFMIFPVMSFTVNCYCAWKMKTTDTLTLRNLQWLYITFMVINVIGEFILMSVFGLDNEFPHQFF